MKLGEVLDRPEVWCQGLGWVIVEGKVVRVCLSGALRLVVRGLGIGATVPLQRDTTAAEREEAQRWTKVLTGVVREVSGSGSFIAFNDARGRTFEEIRAVCEEADRRWMLEAS